MSTLAYTGNSLDRCANRRDDAAWLAKQRQAANARMIHINGDKTIFADGSLVTDVDAAAAETVFLGIDGGGGAMVCLPVGSQREPARSPQPGA